MFRPPWRNEIYCLSLPRQYTAVLVTFAALGAVAAVAQQTSLVRSQAIGIDLSPSFLYAVHYNSASGNFTNVTSVRPGDSYNVFMHKIYQRQQLNSQKHQEAYAAFERWSWLRVFVQSSQLTRWITYWFPQLGRREDFRFTPNTNLDIQITDHHGDSWAEWMCIFLPCQDTKIGQMPQGTNHPQEPLPLNSTNFIEALALSLDSLKVEFSRIHNITITSAVISKPQWIYNDMNKLIEEACLKANIKALDKIDRSDAAMKIAFKEKKLEPLVLEQSVHEFRLQKRSSSMALPDLSSASVPWRLATEMFESEIFTIRDIVAQISPESLHEAQMRLLNEVAKTRNVLKYTYLGACDMLDEQELPVTVPNFGITGFTFTQLLSGKNISRVEAEYIVEIQDAVQHMLLNFDEVRKYQELFQSDGDQDDTKSPHGPVLNTARTTAHPLEASGGSWWRAIDALLVLADFPDSDLILRGSMNALCSIPGLDCKGPFNRIFLHYDLAARGAALEANDHVERWEMDNDWVTCMEDGNESICRHQSNSFEEEDFLDYEHEEL